MRDDILDKIDMVLETFLLKDLFDAAEGSGLMLKMTTLAKLENALIEVE